MFCTNCGREAEGKFCTYCGAQLLVDADPNAQDNASQQPASQIPEPVFDGASASDSSQPQAQQPAAPVSPPAQPVQPPTPPTPPVQPPQKQKKPMSAGKIVLIVLLSLLAVVILLVAACWGLAAKVSKTMADNTSEYLSDLENAIEQVEPIVSETPEATASADGEYVYYDGLLYMTVDQASYDGANIVADVTLWNDCDFGIGAIEDLMVNLYDASGTHVAYGSFFFDGAYDDPAGIIPSGSYTEMTLTFGPNEGDSVTPRHGLEQPRCKL
jgi:hypothetical protein